jgi:hypothetical protein
MRSTAVPVRGSDDSTLTFVDDARGSSTMYVRESAVIGRSSQLP